MYILHFLTTALVYFICVLVSCSSLQPSFLPSSWSSLHFLTTALVYFICVLVSCSSLQPSFLPSSWSSLHFLTTALVYFTCVSVSCSSLLKPSFLLVWPSLPENSATVLVQGFKGIDSVSLCSWRAWRNRFLGAFWLLQSWARICRRLWTLRHRFQESIPNEKLILTWTWDMGTSISTYFLIDSRNRFFTP